MTIAGPVQPPLASVAQPQPGILMPPVLPPAKVEVPRSLDGPMPYLIAAAILTVITIITVVTIRLILPNDTTTIPIVLTLMAPIVGIVITLIKNQQDVAKLVAQATTSTHEFHYLINSRMSELINLTASDAHARGVLAGVEKAATLRSALQQADATPESGAFDTLSSQVAKNTATLATGTTLADSTTPVHDAMVEELKQSADTHLR